MAFDSKRFHARRRRRVYLAGLVLVALIGLGALGYLVYPAILVGLGCGLLGGLVTWLRFGVVDFVEDESKPPRGLKRNRGS